MAYAKSPIFWKMARREMENRAVGGEVLSLVEQLVQRALHEQAGPPASARDTVADRLVRAAQRRAPPHA